MTESTTRRRRARFVPLLLMTALLASACTVLDWDTGGSEREFFCDPTDTAINDGHGDHAGPYTEEKGPLSALDCLLVDFELTNGAAFASLFPTAADAESNGWFRLAPFIPGQGTHHIDNSYGIPTSFDWSRPTMLMYDSNQSTGLLTGMVWVVNSGATPPAGFPGDNDHWHSHHALCFKNGSIIGDGLTDAQCAAIGGSNVDASGIWLLHVWLPEYDGWQATDIFNKTHPSVN